MEAILRLPFDYANRVIDHRKARYLVSALSGAGIALAFAPFYLWPALFLTSLFAFCLFNSETKKEAVHQSLLFTFFLYMANIYWVGNAFQVVGLGALSTLGYMGLPLYMASTLIFASYLAWRFGRALSPVKKAILLGSLLNLAFVVDSFGELAFPWVNYGYALPLPLLQSTSLWGIEGLSVLAVFASLLPFARSRMYSISFAGIFVLLTAFGYWRLSEEGVGTPYNMRLIQPSIKQETKWDPDQMQRNLQVQGLLSQMDAEKPVQAVLWPEASVTFPLQRYPEIQKMLGNAAPNGGHIFLGTLRESDDKVYTSLVVLNDQGLVKGAYDKKHLVPFGEYVPFRQLMPGVAKLTHGARDFTPGTLPGVMSVEGLPPFRALICYEAIFSREINAASPVQPEWLFNMTNDAWYGQSSGPYQHLRIVTVRAIEQGLPLVRVANNGISAVVDPYGRIQHKLELDDVGVIDFNLPKALTGTFYGEYGQVVAVLLILALGMSAIFVSLRRKARD